MSELIIKEAARVADKVCEKFNLPRSSDIWEEAFIAAYKKYTEEPVEGYKLRSNEDSP